jgi:ribosomal protein uL22
MAYKYSYEKFDNEQMARANGVNLAVSLKKSVETLKSIKGKRVESAITFLESVTEQKSVVPYNKYRTEMPHKRGAGIAAGGFPVNVAKAVLVLLKNAQKNAIEREISGTLYVQSASARKGSRKYHMGRNMGRLMKSTSIEVIVVGREVKKAVAKK